MANSSHLRIGSRGSQLALWQANHIAGKLRTHFLWSLVFRPRPLPGSGPDTKCPPGRIC